MPGTPSGLSIACERDNAGDVGAHGGGSALLIIDARDLIFNLSIDLLHYFQMRPPPPVFSADQPTI